MSSRTYAQFCGVAAAMDVLGERWAVLIVRNLLDGPQRYTDLRNGLPGVSTDMLARRLVELEDEGVIQRGVLPPPAASKIYELTELGRQLEPVVLALARWGIGRLAGDDYDDGSYDPRWIELGVRAAFIADRAPRRRITVRFEVGDARRTATISRAGLVMHASTEEPADVDVVVKGTPKALTRVLADPTLLEARLASGDLAVIGDADSQRDLLNAFGFG